jgi:hypothetical protein
VRKRILFIVLILAVILTAVWFAFPSVRCLAGSCTPASSQPRPTWCCNKGKLWFSLPATVYCAQQYGVHNVTVSCQKSGTSCLRNNTTSKIYCGNSDNCNVTGADLPSRLGSIVSNGRWYYKGDCVLSGNKCVLDTSANGDIQNCCVKGNPDPNPTSPPPPQATNTPVCVPQYAPPDFGNGSKTVVPPYPLVISQAQLDTSYTGFTFSTGAILGGIDIKCNTGTRATITNLSAQILLSDSAINYINTYLKQRYYNATVLGHYPVTPPFSTSGIGTTSAMITALTYPPVDPGTHLVRVTATQSDGQSETYDYPVNVYLQDNTLDQQP